MIESLIAYIKQSQKIVFFGGAGVSTNSGIPDFRSAKGIFVQEQGYQLSPEQIVSHQCFQRYPDIFFDFYFEKLVYPNAKPNVAHYFAKWLEDLGKEVTVITQNIDGLHQVAGSQNVIELHGSVKRNFCTQCGHFYDDTQLHLDEDGIPRCLNDNAIYQPDVLMIQEDMGVILQKVMEQWQVM